MYVRFKLIFMHKNDKFAFWAILWGVVSGNVCTSSVARWRARGGLPIRDNWTFFASSYGWDVISRYRSNSAFFKGVGQFDRKFQVAEDITHQYLSVTENYCDYPFIWCHNIGIRCFLFVTKHGRTDRITISRLQYRASIAATRAKNETRQSCNATYSCVLYSGLSVK